MPDNENKRLYPVRLQLTNLQGLAAFDMTVSDKRLTFIAGKNGCGKTTILGAYDAALRGKNKCPDMPIKIGETESVIQLTLREGLNEKYLILRSMRARDDGPDTNTLHLYDTSGDTRAGVRKPQEVLSAMTNAVAFRPADIMRDNANRLKLLLHAIGKQQEYDDNRAKYRATFEGRTAANKDVEALAGRLAATPNPDPSKTIEHIDTAAAAAALATINNKVHQRAGLKARHQSAIDAERELKDRIAELQSQLRRAGDVRTECLAALDAFGEIDEGKPAEELARIEANNAAAATQANHHAIAADLEAKRTETKTQAAALKALDDGLATMVADSSIGQQIPGLSMKGADLQYNDHPFEQASSRQQRELAMLVGIAANPTLRASFIDEADGIDDDGLRHFAELAEQHDMYLFFAGARLPDETLADVAQFVQVDEVAKRIIAERAAAPPPVTHLPTAAGKTVTAQRNFIEDL